MSKTTEYPAPPFPKQATGEPPGLERDMEPRPQYEAPRYRAADKLQGLVALVTGGDSGIGRSVGTLFAREGAQVAFTFLPDEAVDAQEATHVLEELGKKALPLAGDIRSPDECRRIVDKTIERYGRLDILVNNAAFQKHQRNAEDVTEEQWDKTFRTNIYGYFYMVKAALPHLQRGSVIINTGSITGLEGSGGLIDYSSTKGAIHAFTKSLAQNLLQRGIRVNCVAPGPVWTPLNPAERNADEIRDFGGETGLGRPAQPEEIAPAYVFFASIADSGFITGEVLALLGGNTTAG